MYFCLIINYRSCRLQCCSRLSQLDQSVLVPEMETPGKRLSQLDQSVLVPEMETPGKRLRLDSDSRSESRVHLCLLLWQLLLHRISVPKVDKLQSVNTTEHATLDELVDQLFLFFMFWEEYCWQLVCLCGCERKHDACGRRHAHTNDSIWQHYCGRSEPVTM